MTIPGENDAERRAQFIAGIRAKLAKSFAMEERGEAPKLSDMDARRCQGEILPHVKAAIEAELDRMRADSIATPLHLSAAALKTVDKLVGEDMGAVG